MKPARAGAAALAAVLALGACGTTYIDTDVTVPDTASDVTTTTLPPIPTDEPIADLLGEIRTLMAGLDQQIVDDDHQLAAMQRIDELWDVAEPRIRRADPDDVVNFEEAIALARSGVERRRPADASKGYKVIVGVIDDYLADPPSS